MLLHLLKRDLNKKKSVSAILFVFVFLSALLAAAGANMIRELALSMSELLVKSAVPHYVQMHSGTIDEREIERWAADTGLVDIHQTVEMVPLEGSHIYFGDRGTPESTSVMDFYFVQQNEKFDFLLNLSNERAEVAEGEIAVPLFFMRQRNLSVGDRLRIVHPDFVREFTIRDFVRDAQMNPSIIHSKRFVVHPADYEFLKRHIGSVEYLIEFRLTDSGKLGEFNKLYQSSNLPKVGPSIDLNMFRLLNALTDGVIAVVTIFVSLLLILIAMLCVRFTLLSTLEEDYREIGVLKAIGASRRNIRSIYLVKYVVLAATASLCGFAASFPAAHLMVSNITLYLGGAERDLLYFVLPLVTAAVLFGLLLLFCMLVLRRFHRISAVEALRSGSIGDVKINKSRWRLHHNRFLPIPVFLGLKNVFQRLRMFGLLFFVFAASAFLLLVPIHFLNTIQSPDFVSYLGIGRSDLRIDLQYSDRMNDRFRRTVDAIRQDGDVERFSPLVTSRFRLLNDDGTVDLLNVETGDFTIFPLEYVQGGAPLRDNEIALSVQNAREMERRVGDTIRLLVGGEEKVMVVSGIYQDITNGGRTAKARLPYDPDSVLWYTISLDLKPGVDAKTKIAQYEKAFEPAKVTDLKGYIQQTLGQTIAQLRNLAILAFFVSIFLSMLMTALFLSLLIAKERPHTAILHSIGFAHRHIRTQYVTMSLAVLIAGIVIGTILSNTLGQILVGAIWSLLGASNIRFVIEPVQAYVVCPLILMLVVVVTTWIGTGPNRKVNIAEMIKE
ncbi:MAG: ABC transporter permease [Thermobacillus sp.]|uniref:ABC transporter permease n=1 Tax=Thermobacillus sp. TaxID=2108467 RepID=UPI000E36C557|nr:FtsX-like permease family protein [Thermobacillus sp.]REK54652.1 MAG: ABC transporter permease [Thermobacillus sp.]